ncbi:transcriptional regulator, MarR family/acetyltransferase, GNAT family [Pseudomonas fluorescens Q2-87]|uniref:Transcriptional regulator, MarR family/acetyltransferase, GNAT family n=1 Tax=Pseudomonas fluorescens (strain Q2-87) TaxID=1038922 RepID=J2YEM2_PSEFQ|nr:bifunctional helix-turn-helix transcriptional regulator/GNAT family N-acetyltransferase [Pseudomonas fluorescens]EJL05756.1 transcriptional regulator, MarR family/acetyltransferase, GNAT family [Pseudomonas fluorescens Q2-87]
MNIDPALVDGIRTASRTMVREWGFLGATLATTVYSPSAVHALLEIEAANTLTAAQLVQVLGLDKSSVSRMVGKLIKAGELQESAGNDGRIKKLQLTQQGRMTVARIHAYGQAQVKSAMQKLNPSQQRTVALGLAAYAHALTIARTGEAEAPGVCIELSTGYRPGIIGRLAEMHAGFYSTHWGFGPVFESQVACGVAEFVGRLDQPCNSIWSAIVDGRIVGSIAIDGEDLGRNEAHLRWFILEDECRGCGVGRQLLDEAVGFCDRVGFDAIQLWTFQGLDAARRLYEASGFELTKEEQGNQWGTVVTEQRFTRYRNG